MSTPVPRPAHAVFDLLRVPWIPCERSDGSLVFLGIEDVLIEAHALAAVHDSSPVVTVMLHRLLLAILHRAFAPRSREEWLALWISPSFDRRVIHAYLDTVRARFDLFHADYPFLQVPRLDEALEEKKGKSPTTPAYRMAPERSQYGGAAYLFARLPDNPAIEPGEAARTLLAFQGFTAGGRIQNESESRKSGILRGAAPVLLRGRTVRETLLWNLTWHADRKATDVPPWERKMPQRASRAPEGVVDMLLWPSRRAMLVPERDAKGQVVVCDVITAAGEDMNGDYADPHVAYRKIDETAKSPKATAIKMFPARAMWRDALAIFDPETGTPGFRQPLAIAQMAALLRDGAGTNLPMPVAVDVFGLVTSQSKNVDARIESMPIPASVLVDPARLAILRGALAEADGLGAAIRNRVLYALAMNLLVDPDKAAMEALRDNLGTLPAYWKALGGSFPEWLLALGNASADDLASSVTSWRATLRATADKVVFQAVEDIGLAGSAIRAGVAAERVLERVIAELLPLTDGEKLPTPTHEPPDWTDWTGFIPAIEKLIKDENLGALAALRTSLQAANRIGQDAKSIVEPLLPPWLINGGPGRHTRRCYYLVAALAAEYRESAKGVSFGTALRRLHDPSLATSSTTERFETILAAHPNDVGEAIYAAIALVYERGALDWERLLHDMIFWGRRDRLIQRGWARDFYAGPASDDAIPTDTKSDDTDTTDEESP